MSLEVAGRLAWGLGDVAAGWGVWGGSEVEPGAACRSTDCPEEEEEKEAAWPRDLRQLRGGGKAKVEAFPSPCPGPWLLDGQPGPAPGQPVSQ